MRFRSLDFGLAALLAITACSDPAAAHEHPSIAALQASPLQGNVLGALVTVTTAAAESVRVEFHLAGLTSGTDSVTPAVVIADDNASVPVFGLLAESSYIFRAVAFGASGRTTTSEDITFTTGALPGDLAYYSATGDDPSPGYVVFAAGRYGIVIDNTGRVVWYHEFPNGPGLNFMPQFNGRYVARPSTPDPGDVETWVEVNVLGENTRSLGCASGLVPRLHDLIANADGSYWLLCDETRTMDLSQIGGVAGAKVTGTVVQRIAANGSLLFNWTAFDHLSIEDVDMAERVGATVNWTHGNSIDIDAEGNLLVSFRNLNEVTKINTQTGHVIWRLGGRANQFTLSGGAQHFRQQHSVRAISPGTFLILDNVGGVVESRAEEWRINTSLYTAGISNSHGSNPIVMSPIGGSVQRLPGGRTLVSFGMAGRVEEYDETGTVRWRLQGNTGYIFRAQRINSLYNPGLSLAR